MCSMWSVCPNQIATTEFLATQFFANFETASQFEYFTQPRLNLLLRQKVYLPSKSHFQMAVCLPQILRSRLK